MKLLLVAKPDQQNRLVPALREAGYEVVAAANGAEGITHLQKASFSSVVFDTAAAFDSTFPFLQQLSQQPHPAVTVALAPREAVQEQVRALKVGADASLHRDCEVELIIATLQSLQRRNLISRAEKYKVADLEVDVIRRHASRAGQRLDLTPKEFSLLSLLIQRTGETVSRAEISEQVWEMQLEGDTNLVDVHIRRLRAKLDDPFNVKLIQTVRGSGYALRPSTG